MAFRLKKVDEKISKKERAYKAEALKKELEFKLKISELEASFSSLASFHERRRGLLEKASDGFDVFAGEIATLYTQMIAKLKKVERGEEISDEFEKRLSDCEEKAWHSYADANKAKRILQLNKFNKTADLLIKVMTCASRSRTAYQQFVLKKSKVSSEELNVQLQDFRNLSVVFLAALSEDYESLDIKRRVES
jgi:hypothetical protein